MAKFSPKDILKHVTIEPMVALFMFAYGLNIVTRPSLIVLKSCINVHNYTQELCDNIEDGNHNEDLTTVQGTVSVFERNVLLISMPIRIAFCIIGGIWIDKHGRKKALLFPMLGRFLVNLVYILNVALLEKAPFELLYLDLINEVCGNFILYYLCVCAYMADVTDPASRTSRMAIVDGADYIFTMIGSSLSGVILSKSNYYAVFGLSAGLSLLAFVYGAFFIKESLTSKLKKNDNDESAPLLTKTGSNSNGNFCTEFISGFKSVFRKREDHKRTILVMLIFNFACYSLTYNGTEGSHRYLFTQYKYGWNETDFSLYYSVYRIVYLVTLWGLLPFVNKVLKLHDATIQILANISGALGMLMPAIIIPSWGMYLGCAMACFVPAGTITIRSMSSRCVDDDELGKMFSVTSLMDAIGSSLFAAMFQSIYSATVNSFAGAFLIVNACVFLLATPNDIYIRKKLK